MSELVAVSIGNTTIGVGICGSSPAADVEPEQSAENVWRYLGEFATADFETFDHIIVMDRRNEADVMALDPADRFPRSRADVHGPAHVVGLPTEYEPSPGSLRTPRRCAPGERCASTTSRNLSTCPMRSSVLNVICPLPRTNRLSCPWSTPASLDSRYRVIGPLSKISRN